MNQNDAALLNDPRTAHIAEVMEADPTTVVEFAEAAAEANGDTVDEELTLGDQVASLIDGTDPDADDDDSDDDDDNPLNGIEDMIGASEL